ncbi:glutamic acid-rich protein-like [Centruroides vittatus]|uniref:glutamic acid-rich protein-like n=1 Tax=Centruroides vittatus TaxID=120091 RepID=UPI00351000F3
MTDLRYITYRDILQFVISEDGKSVNINVFCELLNSILRQLELQNKVIKVDPEDLKKSKLSQESIMSGFPSKLIKESKNMQEDSTNSNTHKPEIKQQRNDKSLLPSIQCHETELELPVVQLEEEKEFLLRKDSDKKNLTPISSLKSLNEEKEKTLPMKDTNVHTQNNKPNYFLSADNKNISYSNSSDENSAENASDRRKQREKSVRRKILRKLTSPHKKGRFRKEESIIANKRDDEISKKISLLEKKFDEIKQILEERFHKLEEKVEILINLNNNKDKKV